MEVSNTPTATAPIIHADASDTDPVNQAIAGMMLALQAGRELRTNGGVIEWLGADGQPQRFTADGAYWDAGGAIPTSGTHPTLAENDDTLTIQNWIDHLLTASVRGWAIRGGRRPDSEGNGTIGFITWNRVNHGNVPRLEIDPSGTITLWYHWPEADLTGDD